MSYERYWTRPSILAPKTCAARATDVRRVVDALPEGTIRADDGINEPDISDECVSFNGNATKTYVYYVGEPAWHEIIGSEREVQSRWHDDDAYHRRRYMRLNPPLGASMPFVVPQVFDDSFPKRGLIYCDERGWFHTSCQTNGRPYDVAVVAALILMKHHFPSACDIESDGTFSDWKFGLDLAMNATGLVLSIPKTIPEDR